MKPKIIQKGIVLEDGELNTLFEAIYQQLYSKRNRWEPLNIEGLSWQIENDYQEEHVEEVKEKLCSGLKDYKVKIKTDGDHKNDGQMVEYTFFFQSKDGKETKIETEMCLMVGWNHWMEETIR